MRGALIFKRLIDNIHRIIPTDAGSTTFPQIDRKVEQDHPRGCGEHEHYLDSVYVRTGIIPADAGST